MTSIKSLAICGHGETGLFRVVGDACRRQRFAVNCIGLMLLGMYAAAAEDRQAANPAPVVFHIPAQPLANALQAYGEQAGVQVLYESRSAAGQQSVSVDGSFTAEAALNRLLSGTDLKIRYTRPDAITIAALFTRETEAAADLPAKPDLSIGTLRVHATNDDEDTRWLNEYGESVQLDVQRALQKNARTRTGNYRVVVDLWIDPSRAIERARLQQSTGDPDRDAAVAAALRGTTMSKPAPANMPRPVRVAITVRSAR